jgi:hypothetical protein
MQQGVFGLNIHVNGADTHTHKWEACVAGTVWWRKWYCVCVCGVGVCGVCVGVGVCVCVPIYEPYNEGG